MICGLCLCRIHALIRKYKHEKITETHTLERPIYRGNRLPASVLQSLGNISQVEEELYGRICGNLGMSGVSPLESTSSIGGNPCAGTLGNLGTGSMQSTVQTAAALYAGATAGVQRLPLPSTRSNFPDLHPLGNFQRCTSVLFLLFGTSHNFFLFGTSHNFFQLIIVSFM